MHDGLQACRSRFIGYEQQKCKEAIKDGEVFVKYAFRMDGEATATTEWTRYKDGYSAVSEAINEQDDLEDITIEDLDEPFAYSARYVTPEGDTGWREF